MALLRLDKCRINALFLITHLPLFVYACAITPKTASIAQSHAIEIRIPTDSNAMKVNHKILHFFFLVPNTKQIARLNAVVVVVVAMIFSITVASLIAFDQERDAGAKTICTPISRLDRLFSCVLICHQSLGLIKIDFSLIGCSLLDFLLCAMLMFVLLR